MTQSQSNHQDDHHEIVCIGFGPAAISLAIKLAESRQKTDVLFLEARSKETWQPIPDLPGHVHMKENFLNDLVTMDNPRSKFTFVRFLKERKLLVEFTNLSLMTPSRELFSEYLSWCAKQFRQQISYKTRVNAVEPIYSKNAKVCGWSIFAENGTRRVYTAQKLIVFTGQELWLPPVLRKSKTPSVVHSSQCLAALSKVAKMTNKKVKIAILGHTQDAAELFNHLYDVRADREVIWLLEGSSLQTDSQPALNASNPFFATPTNLPPELRVSEKQSQQPNFSPVDPALIVSIYENEYFQSIKEADSSKWQFRVRFNQIISDVRSDSNDHLQICYRDRNTDAQQMLDVDLLIAATGYVRDTPDHLFSGLVSKRLLEGSALDVDAEYRLNFRRGVIKHDVGLWCVGSIGIETATGEDAFHIMAERSTRLADSLAKCNHVEDTTSKQVLHAQL